jgi:hypothetical protein
MAVAPFLSQNVGLALLIATATPALAQPAPPPGNIDERVRQQVRTPTEREQQDALMTGDTDILLLRRTKMFTLSGGLDVTGTSNAYLSPVDLRADSFAQGQVSLGIGTRIGGKVDVFASASIVGVRYFRETSLDYNAISGVVGARANLGRLAVTATYQPSMVYTRDFGRRQLTSHRFRLGASLPFQIRGLTVDPEIHGERAITHPGDYSAWSGGGSLTLSAPLSKVQPILAYALVGYDRRSFDDYFEAFVGTKRLDDNLSAGIGVVWRPRAWGEVRASYSFGRNWSTSDVNGYTAHSGTFGLTATLRF